MAIITTDQAGFEFSAKPPFERIVSLVPSLTELLFHFGLGHKIVGITDYCIYPAAKLSSITRVGGTKTVDLQKLAKLQPDLVLASKEENNRSQIESIKELAPVWVSDVLSLENTFELISRLSEVFEIQEKGVELNSMLQTGFSTIPNDVIAKVAYLIWENPLMVAAGNTLIDDILKRSGFENAFSNTEKYPKITSMNLAESGVEVVFLSSEPFRFGPEHISHYSKLSKGAKVLVVNGEMFSWYGSRLLQAPAYLNKLRTIVSALLGKYPC